MKQNEAQAFVKAHAMSNPNSSVSMTMAPGLQASSRISAAWLQACSTLLGLSVANAAMIAASSSTMQVRQFTLVICCLCDVSCLLNWQGPPFLVMQSALCWCSTEPHPSSLLQAVQRSLRKLSDPQCPT